MTNHITELKNAVREQLYATFFDAHLASPLLGQSTDQRTNKDEKKYDNFSVRLPVWVKEKLGEISKEEGLSVNMLICNAVTDAVIKHIDRKAARQVYKEMLEALHHEPPLVGNEDEEIRELIEKAATKAKSNPLRK